MIKSSKMRNSLGGPCRPKGFTLLELMLVLTIIAIIGSFAIPAFDRLIERQRLRGAAEEMRLAWDGARLKAMRSGQAQVFQCQTNSNSYQIQPLILHDDANNIGDGATIMMGAAAVETTSNGLGMATTGADTTKAGSKTIDQSLKFASCVVAGDLRTYSMAQSGESATVTIQNINQSIIFYPDGTTSDAELKVQNEQGDTVGVQIRGLTGHTKLLPLVAGGGKPTP